MLEDELHHSHLGWSYFRSFINRARWWAINGTDDHIVPMITDDFGNLVYVDQLV